jgi:hypothetical protein
MSDQRPDTPARAAPAEVSAAWLGVLDLGVPSQAPRREDALAMNVFARLADCMP